MSFSIIIVGAVAAFAFWLSARTNSIIGRLLIGLVCCLAGATMFYILAPPSTLGAGSWWNQSPWREAVLFTLMLVGMAIRYITKAIEERRERIAKWMEAGKPGSSPGLEFDSWEFVYPMLLSAITFGSILPQIKGVGLGLADVLLAFQTGFFWQTLLASKLAQK